VDLGSAALLVGCNKNTALSALVLNILEGIDQVRDTGQANEEAESKGPQTADC